MSSLFLRLIPKRPAQLSIGRTVSRMSSSSAPRILNKTELKADQARFIKLLKFDWRDQDGKDASTALLTFRVWEVAERSTRTSGGVDAVAILPIIYHPPNPPQILVIEQYRPPVEKFVIELPAGLIDPDEGPETTALRELVEETGYGGDSEGAGTAKIIDVTPVIVNDPGMTSANMQLVTVRIDIPEGDQPAPKAKLEPGEHIVTRLIPIADLQMTLKEYAKKENFIVDARLEHWTNGLVAGMKFALGAD